MKTTIKTALCALGISLGLLAGMQPKVDASDQTKGAPDLFIAQLQPGASYENKMSVYVYNKGNKSASASYLGVNVYTWIPKFRSSILHTYKIATPAIAPGTGQWVSIVPYQVSLFSPGTSVQYIADVDNTVTESDETNNEIDLSY